MTHDGVQYALIPDQSAREATRLLLPGKKGYEVLATPVSQVLQFQQVVQIPTTAQSGISSATTGTLPEAGAATKPKKPQPKGLKMRFKPSGFGVGDLGAIGSSDEEDAQPAARFRVPVGTEPASASKKRKDRTSGIEKESEKKKKKKSKEAADVATKNAKYSAEATKAIDIDQPTAPVQVVAKEKSKKKEKKAKKIANVGVCFKER